MYNLCSVTVLLNWTQPILTSYNLDTMMMCHCSCHTIEHKQSNILKVPDSGNIYEKTVYKSWLCDTIYRYIGFI